MCVCVMQTYDILRSEGHWDKRVAVELYQGGPCMYWQGPPAGVLRKTAGAWGRQYATVRV